jgi:hypothetical protein
MDYFHDGFQLKLCLLEFVVHLGEVRLRLLTAATNGPIVNLLGDI